MAAGRMAVPGSSHQLRHLLCAQAAAQQFIVGQGSRLDLGTSTLDVGCREVVVAGELAMASGALPAARNVDATGSVQGGSGLLAFGGDQNIATAFVPGTSTMLREVGATLGSVHIAPGPPDVYDSIDRGNSPRFLGFDAPLPIPSQSWLSLLLLALLLAATAAFRFRRI